MEKNYIRSDFLMELEVLTEKSIGLHYHNNFELLYLLSGNLEVSIEEQQISMKEEDIVIINTNRNHGYRGTGDVLIARFLISYDKLRDLLNKDSILFLCNSTLDKNNAFNTLRDIIGKVLNHVIRKDSTQLYLNSLYYQILYILTSNFLLTSKDIRYRENTSSDQRVDEVFAYIRMNYRKNITLQEVGKQLYLSPTYLSKYIKKKCGMNFGELISSVRMEHAMEDLLYTDAPIMKIAMDNGFASVAAYNKVFKEIHKMTPSEFRKKMNGKSSKREDLQRLSNEKIQQKIEDYLEKKPVQIQENKQTKILDVYGSSDESLQRRSCGDICKMINAGTAVDLTKAFFQKQILEAKDRLGIEYVRFWDIYAPEFYIDIHEGKENLYFGQLDVVFDFLVQNKLKPYVELGFKPIRLLKNTQKALKETDREEDFHTDEEMKIFYSGLIEHFVKRYGGDEVENWYFEYGERENLIFRDLSYRFHELKREEHENYLHRFDILAGVSRKVLNSIRIGGGGFPLQHYGVQGFAEILKMWKQHEQQPDFLSITSFPYQLEKEGFTYYEKKNVDQDFVLHNIEGAKEAMKREDYDTVPLHVCEYSMSLSNRNVINDSCSSGAFLMQNAIMCSDKAEIMGYWLLTDLYSDFYDSQNLLFGGCGLMNKNGIPKPGFHAFAFYQHLYKNVIACGRNYIVTRNRNGNFRILCHNYKELNYNYYIAQEDEIKIEDIPGMMEDREYLTIRLNLSVVPDGQYKVKQNIVNREHGSIQDARSDLDQESDLGKEDLMYLEKISMPKLLIQKIEVKHNELEYHIMLQPNEIQYISIEPV